MSRPGLARVWAVLGGLLALYAIGTWIVMQGGKSLAEIPGLEPKSPITSASLAVPIIGILLGLQSIVGLLYMRSGEGTDGLLPVVAIADTGPHRMSSWSMRAYQAFFFLIYLLIPAASLYALNGIILERGILWHEGDPALGTIALKNVSAWTEGASAQDKAEYACASKVVRDGPNQGFTWLGNQRCDFVKAGRLKPFNKEGEGLAEDAAAAPTTGPMTCTRDLAIAQSSQQTCDGVRDLSEECETSERSCRGVQWLPVLSPLLLALPTAFGWVIFAWLIVEASWRTMARSKMPSSARHGGPTPAIE